MAILVRSDGSGAIENLPVFLMIVVFLGAATTYAVSTAVGATPPYLPYISNAGGLPPQSGFLSLTLYISGILVLFIGLIRYRQVAIENIGDHSTGQLYSAKIIKWNRRSLYFAVLCLLGMFIVGAFPVHDQLGAHMAGAFCLFFFGLVYQGIHTYISYLQYKFAEEGHLMHHAYNRRVLCSMEMWQVRLILLVSCLSALLIVVIGGGVSKMQVTEEDSKRITAHGGAWDFSYSGWSAHVASTSGEWIAVMIFMIFFMSFRPGFRTLMWRPDYIFVNNPDLETPACSVCRSELHSHYETSRSQHSRHGGDVNSPATDGGGSDAPAPYALEEGMSDNAGSKEALNSPLV